MCVLFAKKKDGTFKNARSKKEEKDKEGHIMSLVRAVETALKQGRVFRRDAKKDECPTFDVFMRMCDAVFHSIDQQLFDGALSDFFESSDITFETVASTSGPAGLTTYSDDTRCMRVALRKDAWKATYPALVGGNLCHSGGGCLLDVFLHEIVHVLLFSIYIQIDMSSGEVEELIPFRYDPTHNILFTTWLACFFNQHTINNSLLLCGTAKEPLVFNRDMRETEYVCVHRPKRGTKVHIFRNGQKERATVLASNTFFNSTDKLKPHHSHVRTESGHSRADNDTRFHAWCFD